MANTATRLISLIMLLQRRPNQKAADLADELGVSARTLHRYIEMLDEMGIPVYSERGPHGGFSLVRGYKMPPLIFTPEEAVAVYLGTGLVDEMWGQLYREAAQGALAKLDNVLPDEQRHEVNWARRTLLATHLHRADTSPLMPILEKLRRATRERRRTHMVYRARSRLEPLRRDVDPYALVHRWGWWYVVGYCHLREDVRSFRVDRIVDLMLLEEPFNIPADFDAREYLASEPHLQPRLEMRLRFVPEGISLVMDDRALWDSIEEQPDGSIIATVKLPNLEMAVRMVLYYGDYAEVMAPDELRELVAEQAQALIELYKK
jgi:predicted DNA-binding transcriptional regulator YafY